MRKIPCYCYQEGVDFIMPLDFAAAPRAPSPFTVMDESGRAHPSPEVFTEVFLRDEAEVFLFPWAIGKYIDTGKRDAIWDLIASLPYIEGRERRHIVWDDGDFVFPPLLPVCFFKISVTADIAKACVAAPYTLPPHIFQAAPSFDWSGILYDVSFVGNATNPLRRAAAASIRQQAPGVRFLADFDTAFVVRNGYFHNTRERADQAETLRREALFRKSLERSLAVLCPPGIGPYSIRMYETMYMGRVPILFEEGAVYPLENMIDYTSFCVRIRKQDVMDTGNILRRWLETTPLDEIRQMGVVACGTWNRFFAPGKILPFLLAEAGERFWNEPAYAVPR